jgi:ParB-like chromosome segregation protein Spo0J
MRDAWDATLQEVKRRSRRVAAYVTPSHPVQLEDGTLVIEVQSEFHKDAMSDEKSRSMLADAIHAALGVRPLLRFVARGAQPEATAPPDEAAAMDDLSDAVAADAVEHDPVELIKKGFRAEVVEDRIGP